jgi:hypothetical protein
MRYQRVGLGVEMATDRRRVATWGRYDWLKHAARTGSSVLVTRRS